MNKETLNTIRQDVYDILKDQSVFDLNYGLRVEYETGKHWTFWYAGCMGHCDGCYETTLIHCGDNDTDGEITDEESHKEWASAFADEIVETVEHVNIMRLS